VTSYRFRRRAFIAAMSGGVGLKIMLRNLEGAAQGMPSPARLLVTHWPIGVVSGANNALWTPTSGSVGGSPGLKPFADQGLGNDMTVIRGLSTINLNANGGGGHEAGTVLLVTGRSAGGVRTNRAQASDAFASPGGSIDQILLQNVPALQRPGPGFAGSIADMRTDDGGISTKCLSYSTESQNVMTYSGTSATEAKPMLGVLSPLEQYTNLFGSFVPGTAGAGGASGTGGAGGSSSAPVADATLKKLVGKKSVLDFALEELNQVRQLAPSEARNKLSNHSDAILSVETQIANAINKYPTPGGAGGTTGTGGAGGTGGNGGPTCGGGCTTKPSAPPDITGNPDWNTGFHGDYSMTYGTMDESTVHAAVGAAHLGVLKAAFICDLIRVGTFQWAPGFNHVAFGGLYPNDTRPYEHHPTSHKIGGAEVTSGVTPADLNVNAAFLYNVQLWYYARHAENLATWKTAVDGCGNGLLDYTCVPFLTEVTQNSHERSNMAGMIIGGTKLGFQHGRYVTGNFSINQFWGTIAQAYGYTSTAAPFAAPLDGFWAKPA